MQIPNAIIHIRQHDGGGHGPLIVPEYFVPIFRRAMAGKLDPNAPGRGIEVTKYPDDGSAELRYREVTSLQHEMEYLRRVYKGTGGVYYADLAYPEDTFKKEIERILLEESKRLAENSKPRAAIEPHKSFIDFGLAPDTARALQAAGYGNRASCIGASLFDLGSVMGLSLPDAQRLSQEDVKPETKK